MDASKRYLQPGDGQTETIAEFRLIMRQSQAYSLQFLPLHLTQGDALG